MLKVLSIFISILIVVHCKSPLSPLIDNKSLVNYRLPNNSLPLHYFLRIETNIHNGDDKFSGYEKIRIKLTEATDAITIHCNSESVRIKSIDLYDEKELPIKLNLAFNFIDEYEFVVIDLESRFLKNSEIVLSISYLGILSDNIPRGFFKTAYLDDSFNQINLIATYLQPTYARMAFPCFDEPQIRATFQLEIQHDKSYKAISNTPVLAITDHQNYAVTQFETTPSMQSYLLAFIVSQFDSIENNEILPQKIYGDPMKLSQNHGDFAMDAVTQVHSKIQEIFNFTIPLKKIDHVAVPNMNAAMESFGLITYDENILLLNPNYIENVLDYLKRETIGFIAHEFMHQMMGNVAIQWWQYLWLNEGLATFYQYLIPSLIYPKFKYMELFNMQVVEKSFMMDDVNETMNEYVETPEEIFRKFNSISFEKSAAIIRMFYEALTPATFTKGLRYYFEEMKFKAATPDDLHKALQRSYDEDNEVKIDVGKMMASWQNLAGFPILSIERSGNSIVVKKNKYSVKNGEFVLMDYPKIFNDPLPTYSIPLTFTTASTANFNSTKAQLWMTTDSMVIPNIGTNEWIIFNVQQVGYYKVDYSRDLWMKIIEAYKESPWLIHKVNREMLHDAMLDGWLNLGTQSISNCLELLGVLGGERDGNVWLKAGNYIEKLNEFFLFSELYDDFLNLMHTLLTPHVQILEIGSDENSKLFEEVTRWSRETRHASYLNLQFLQLMRFMDSGDIDDRPDFCSAFRVANSSIYQFFIDKVFNETMLFDFDLISGLGCTNDAIKLKEFLERLLNPKTIINEFIISQTFYSTMKSSVSGLEVVMEISHNRTSDITRVTKFPAQNMLMLLSNVINSPRHLEKYKTLTNKLVYDGIITREETMPLLSAIEQKLQSPEWSEIRNWFEMRQEETTTSSSSSSSFSSTTSWRQIETTSTLASPALSTSIRVIAICVAIKTFLM